jgi:hypothetical protein
MTPWLGHQGQDVWTKTESKKKGNQSDVSSDVQLQSWMVWSNYHLALTDYAIPNPSTRRSEIVPQRSGLPQLVSRDNVAIQKKATQLCPDGWKRQKAKLLSTPTSCGQATMGGYGSTDWDSKWRTFNTASEEVGTVDGKFVASSIAALLGGNALNLAPWWGNCGCRKCQRRCNDGSD